MIDQNPTGSLLGSAPANTDPDSLVHLTTARIGKPWSISNQGITFIAIWESGIRNGLNWQHQRVTDGFILTVYDDGYGIPTVGLGHAVVPQDNLRIGNRITIEQARQLFRKDSQRVEENINNLIRVPLFQYEYDALVSILFNTGYGRGAHDSSRETRGQRVANALNAGNYNEAANFLEHFIAGRTASRRVSEANLFRTGVYDASH